MKQTELYYKETNGLAPFAYIVISQWMYFCDQCTPALFRYHFKTKICECVAVFNEKYVNTNFYKILAYENELWLLPFLDGKIICFDMVTYKVSYYDIPEEVEEKTIPFFDMVFNNDSGYITPYGNNRYLIKMDLATHKIQPIELVKIKQASEQSFFRGTIFFQNKIYLVDTDNGFIIVYDINCKKAIEKSFQPFPHTYPKRINDKIYFFPVTMGKYKNILVYHISKEEFYEKEFPIKSIIEDDVGITEIFNEKIWILVNKQKKIYRLNQDLKIELEISITNFNEEEKTIYVSSTAFENMFFWHGHTGTPLIQVDDESIKVLDVCENTNELEIYIKMISRYSKLKEKNSKFEIGKLIYERVNTV